MGFWHTGYMEFHEPIGLGKVYKPLPPVYSCRHCTETFPTSEELVTHRFERHPYHSPVLFINGIEVGSAPLRVTRPLQAGEVQVFRCERARVNGASILPSQLGERLAQMTQDTVTVLLENQGVSSTFNISFEVASDDDLAGVDRCFRDMTRGRRLDMRAIEDFIAAARAFPSAIGYCDGLCEYFCGVLAKERAKDSTLPYEMYREKFSRAADRLKDFRRPLAGAVTALVSFHFNHFSECVRLAGNFRVGIAAARFQRWLEGDGDAARALLSCGSGSDEDIEKLLTDDETEKLISWSVDEHENLVRQLPDLESFVRQDLPEFDRAKLRILLAELYVDRGLTQEAEHHARELMNNPTLGAWAERLVERLNTRR